MQGKKILVLLVSIALVTVFVGMAFLTGCSSTPSTTAAPTTTTAAPTLQLHLRH